MKEYITVLKKYAVFQGRARRKEFWMLVLGNFIILIMLPIIFGILPFNVNLSLVLEIYLLYVLISSVAVTVRRLHDTNRSGWWAFPFWSLFALALVGLMLWTYGFYDSNILVVIGFLNSITNIFGVVLLPFLCFDSTPGPNRFGPNPKGVGDAPTPEPSPTPQPDPNESQNRVS